jgi:hypothetical protein
MAQVATSPTGNTRASSGRERCRKFFLRLAGSRFGLVKAVGCCRDEVLAALPDDRTRAFQFWFTEGEDGTGWNVIGRRVGLPEVIVRVPWDKIEGSHQGIPVEPN